MFVKLLTMGGLGCSSGCEKFHKVFEQIREVRQKSVAAPLGAKKIEGHFLS